MSAETLSPRHICRHIHLRRCAVLLLALFCCVSVRAQDDSVLTGGTICLDGSGGLTTTGLLNVGGGTINLCGYLAITSSPSLTITDGSLIYTNTLSGSTNNNFLIVRCGVYGSIGLFTNGSLGLVTTSLLGGSTMSVTNIWISGSTLSVSSGLITGNLVYTNVLLLNSTNHTFATLTIPTLNLGGGFLTNVGNSSIFNVRNGTMSINSGTTWVSRLCVTNGAGGILNFNAGQLTSFGSIVSNGLSLRIGDGTNAASLILPSGSHTFADGLTIAANASLSNASSLNSSNLVIAASGQFTMSEGFAVVNIVTNSGIFIQSGGIFDPAFYHNTGTLQLTGGTNQDTVFLNDVGAIVQHSGGQLDVSVATNFGSWTVSGTAVANLTNFINESGATLSITGGTFNTSQLTATNAGNILYFSAGQLHSGGSAVSNGVAFTVGNGVKSATLNLLGGTHSFANGLFINTNSWLTGTGAITGVITNAGSIAPGDSPGVLTGSSNLTLLSSSLLLMELAGTNSGLYDQINLDGTLTFGGTLTLSLLDGFTVSMGDQFDLFDFSSSSGSFSQFNLPTLSPLLYWDTSELYTSGEIEADRVPPGVIVWGDNSTSQTNVPVGLTAVAAVSAGEGHNMALRSDGTVVAWGGNDVGQTNVPAGLSGVAAISAGNHSMALRNDGTVVAWGRNAEGQTNVPAGLSGVVAIAAGTHHCMAIRSDGTVVAWGDNSDGKTNVPAGLSGVVAIAGSQWHSLALKSNGTVIAWGTSSYGLTNVPTGLSNVVAIAAGPYHNMALKSNGTVVAWGTGLDTVPTGLSNVVAIAAASQHSAALKSDGTVVVWGSNSYGQTNMPEGLRGVVAMGARGLNTMVLRPYGPAVTPSDLMLPSGVRGTSYNHPLQATGGTAPYSWTITSGRLPAGLTLDSSGTINGTPTASGLSCFRVRVTGADGLATDKDLAIQMAADTTPPTLLAAVSRKTHGAAGDYDLNLNLNGVPNATIEPRLGGPNKVVFTFNKAVEAVDGILSANEFTLTNATYSSASIVGSNLTLNLTNVVDQSQVTVVLKGIGNLAGNALSGTNAVRVGVLYGDVNQSGSVNVTDRLAVKSRLMQALSNTNFLYDANASGSVNVTDRLAVKANLYHTVIMNGLNALLTTETASNATVLPAVTLGEALGASSLTWSSDGDAEWAPAVASDGSSAACSGNIGDLNVSWVETTVTGPGTLSFEWAVSSEADADYLTFSIDGVDQPGRLSGEVDWQTLTFNIPSGTHRLTWTYAKNRANAAGVDAGWLRKIVYQRNP